MDLNWQSTLVDGKLLVWPLSIFNFFVLGIGTLFSWYHSLPYIIYFLYYSNFGRNVYDIMMRIGVEQN